MTRPGTGANGLSFFGQNANPQPVVTPVEEPAAGDPVMMTARARFPRVVHKLARVKEGAALYPYVMACGYPTTAVQAPIEGAPRCGRCWPDRDAA